MDLEGNLVDEHHVMYDLGDTDREVFRRAEVEGIHFTVIDNCPIVVQLENETRVVGRGWVVCTPVRSARRNLGMLFNDAALSGAPVDETKQARTAILCSFLGTLLEFGALESQRPAPPASGNRMMVEALRELAKDPSLSGKKLAASLGISLSRLARLFKRETGASLVDYRNQLRLERFQMLVDSGGDNLLEAALSAGFGSYAQFHRVFRAWRGTTPREYLRERQKPMRPVER
jgi:AraC-like DNA-binding protein